MPFAKNIGKNLSNKYGQKLVDSAKKSTADAIKTASKRTIQKTAEATGDLIGKKIADKITTVSNKSAKKLQNDEASNETETSSANLKNIPKKKDTYLQKKDNELLMS